MPADFVKCELCGAPTWAYEGKDEWPFYCTTCDKKPKITFDEIIDIHEDLKKVVKLAFPQGDNQ